MLSFPSIFLYSTEEMQDYAVLDEFSQIKQRRETFLGKAGNSDAKMYLYDYKSNNLTYSKVRFNHGLLKIYDEILVNAIDNLSRSTPRNKLTTIKVNFVEVEGEVGVRIYNDGPSIPIEKYKPKPRREDETDVQYKRRYEEEKKQMGKYLPEVLLTVMRSSSNYNKEEDKTRTTGGLNGFGAKLTALFSKMFIIEVENGGKSYYQEVRNNNENVSKPIIEDCKKNNSSVAITFVPDWKLIDESSEFKTIDNTMRKLMSKRVFDYSHLGLDLYIDDVEIPKLTFLEFANKHMPDVKFYENKCVGEFKKWKVAYGFVTEKAETVSFVNNVVTYDGGQHVTLLQKQIQAAIKSKSKKELNSRSINSKISMIVYATIPGIAFASQAKTALSNDKIDVPTLNQNVLQQFIADNNIVEYLETGKVKSSNTKTSRQRIVTIKKLHDAEEAGTPLDKRRNKHICTLFICEGDSAQTLCDRGISILGEQYFGSYALRGKVLNTLKSTKEQYVKNKELTELKSAIGLVEGKVYTDANSLRYQRIVCCKDADYDGSAIMGLVINFFYQYFRELMETGTFFYEFITPVVNIYNKPYIPKTSLYVKAYYDLRKFIQDCNDGKIDMNKQYCKYIKGLGGNTGRDIERYFADFDKFLIHVDCETDGTNDSVELAYSKKTGFTDKRKTWIASVNNESYLPRDKGEITFNDFCKIDLALAGYDTCDRSIPSIYDGLKPSQRKVLYTYFSMSQKAAKTSTKVFQITGKVADFASYHHGDESLNGTITRMAQDFVGANNLPLLEKDGQFGSRNKLGEDASAPRYIAAYLSDVARLLFPKEDDDVLIRKVEDNETVEPTFYVPIIPMLLVNGALGIGTGWSTNIPMFNPIELLDFTLQFFESFPTLPSMNILPWYRKYKGNVEEYDKEWVFTGVVEQVDDLIFDVTEIPVEMSIDNLRANMNALVTEGVIKKYVNIESSNNKKKKDVEDDSFHFRITFEKKQTIATVYELLKLETVKKKTNMVAFNDKGHPVKYGNIESIYVEWFKKRRETYIKRKMHILNNMELELTLLRNKLRFSEHVDEYDLKHKLKAELLQLLEDEKYFKYNDSYDYLRQMPIDCSAKFKIDKLRELIKQKEKEKDEYESLAIVEIWESELLQLRKYLEKL